jgi:beta-lactamase superfamily II metal-dependent hydrolase
MTFARTLSLCFGLAAASVLLQAQSRNLDIYWIDTEGGAATLIVSPSGESLLVDTGNPGPEDRDPKRIFEVVKMIGLKKIDMLAITHFHGDHVGGAPALSKMVPIEKYYDHGDSVEASQAKGAAVWEAYKTMAQAKRVIVKPGDKIPLKGVDIAVVAANGEVTGKAINGGGSNDFCKDAQHKDADPTENARSVGFLLTYGKFKFLDLGDLTWEKELALTCPVNKVGTVTLFQATHHGFVNGQSGAPPMVWAAKPQVVIVNNGPRKGLEGNAYETMTKIPGIEDIWQSHRAVRNDAAHNTSDSMIANLEEGAGDQGTWLKASIARDGKFTITNGRNQFSKTYTAR